ncbi:SRPBCC domain-containing protein [Antrihabitans sp. YC2-6]|uniref:SRPBCC family protein n=1 Tax=Antrihabitans sp. YC2-6 TaxID=2799498 RepID=UPI0018F6A94C|nr:SRPBCC domain-containing protein [Antrihabitans sp. YC2-6]MBJ8344135.1 SRPBCC domain-containing protein [Antrihabitans sp. YC2-6]
MTESNGVTIEVTIAAAPEVVWQALRDPDLIRRWHGWVVEGLEEEVDFIYRKSVSLDDAANYVFRTDNEDEFSLHPSDAGTVVRITRAPKGTTPEWDDWYDDITEGWTSFLAQLQFGIERHGLAERRTLMLEGRLRDDADVRDTLHLNGLSVGDGHRSDLGFSGSVQLVGANQTAVSVDDAGPGLLVVAKQPINAQRPHGGSMIILTTYGLDDAEHAALQQKWQSWWDASTSVDQPA